MADLFTTALPDITAQLASCAISLPLRQADDDAPTIVDASGVDVFTVDVNRDRPDDEAEGIALFLMNAINAIGARRGEF